MNALRKHYLLILAILAGSVFLASADSSGGQARGAGPSQTSPAPAAQTRGPAPTLTAPATPSQAPGIDGFIRRWLLLEPLPANGLTEGVVQATVKKEYFPNQFTVIPHDGDKAGLTSKRSTSARTACSRDSLSPIPSLSRMFGSAEV